jgi:hypothetical protein
VEYSAFYCFFLVLQSSSPIFTFVSLMPVHLLEMIKDRAVRIVLEMIRMAGDLRGDERVE